MSDTGNTVAGARRRRLRRGIIILPSAFTVGNMFLGVWAIVHATRGDFITAGWLIVLAAVFDMLDGRIARFTATGSAFGEELDSLVDAISFGVAPALIIYFTFLKNGGEWSWIVAFLYITAAVFRLARFNIEQAGTAKSAFHGLPSPTAGASVATYYAFTQTALWHRWFSHVDAGRAAGWLMMMVAVLMVSNVLYPVVPRFSLRTWSGRFAMAMAVLAIVAAFTYPEYFFFPMSIVYIGYGLLRTVMQGFEEKLPDEDPIETVDPSPDEVRPLEYEGRRGPRAAGPPPDALNEELLP
ncbi:CDP-diacylglycerol--serine O-phosphatidyltransferase [Longimicrobium sp.]|uniref:CDP-diacylglycerol--serine O-phosphatidyltransferase n=1 Tax=Longimicrobium sp. TaxID=2029185 RepID=UPI002BF67CC4|nr:CDP-diacylglycerol--serine O-phosphatidyltransferase [Longimicrobium sp.]HSU15824.1 CDP-diacylglycerol--serine O-phosphatidyltransferase [Longimicrobium sp.]